MVYYYVSCEGHVVYMGKDKFENEELLKWGWDEDVWFHVDDLSSAHVYLRMKPDETMETLSKDVLDEMAQLTKENSIEGKKQAKVKIVYTQFGNLQKLASHDVGQVSFKSEKKRKYLDNVERNKDVLKRIQKTEEERFPDLEKEKLIKLKEDKKVRDAMTKQQLKEKKEAEMKRKEEEDAKTYKNFMASGEYTSNKEANNAEDDFM
mmetsp:Transcript_71357/g.83009  ORF Transcript_71357/g.83009 Transcript_71357/m.83009 type:complete len:206 (-) Transcript_71357:174-791(-)